MHFKNDTERAAWLAFAAASMASGHHPGSAKSAAKAADSMLEEYRARDEEPAAEESSDEPKGDESESNPEG